MNLLNAEQLQAVARRDDIITARFQMAIACRADSPNIRDMKALNDELVYFNRLLGIGLPGASDLELRGGKEIAGAMTSEIPSVAEQKRLTAEINARMGK